MNKQLRVVCVCVWAALLSGVAAAQATAPAQPEPPLPPGHPTVAPSTPETGPRGTLAVRAIQGTKGGPEVTSGEVEIVLFHRDQPIKQIKSSLDEHGVVMVSDVPLAKEVRPLVRIKYADLTYQNAGPVMTPQKPTATVMVTVYEKTDEAPPWRVLTRHIATARTEDGAGLSVGETLTVDNPADRTWEGAAPDAAGRRTTVTTMLPEGASDIVLGRGFHGWCCTALNNGRLEIQMPLMPGKMTYQFAYRLPTTDGKVGLLMANTARADHVSVFVPDDGAAAEPTIVKPGDLDTSGPSPLRSFHADDVPADAKFGVVLAQSAGPSASRNAAATTAPGRSFPIGYIGAAVAGLLVLAGVGVLILRPKARKPA